MKELTWKQAIIKILKESKEAMNYIDITERIIKEGLRDNIGATPTATVSAQITSSIKRDGVKSPFIRVGKGTYILRSSISLEISEKKQENKSAGEQSINEEEQYEIITSFGMFWTKDAVEWVNNPKLLGTQQIGSEPIDFSSQSGVYFLYDRREVIYIGRATEGSLGLRLFQHTRDRHSSRWDRFSWFGLLPVSDEGVLGKMPDRYDSSALIPALEAVLIEALEPRQNRKRGDDLAAVEYIQMVDPEIEKKRKQSILKELEKKL